MEHFTFKLLANRDFSMVYTFAGIAGGFLSYTFGGWSGVLEILLLFFATDYITGCIASIKEGKGLKSSIGFFGIIKKGLMLLMVLLGHRIDLALGMSLVMNGVIYFWLANELVSILENYGRLGLKTPDILKKVITVLQDREKKDD